MIDERPVGVPSNSQGADLPGAVVAEEDFSQVPLGQLLTHSNWKARKEGYDKVQANPGAHKALVFDNIKSLCTEGNSSAQDSLFGMFAELVEHCDKDEQSTLCGLPLRFALEKGITGRPKAVSATQSFAVSLVENTHPTEVMPAVLDTLHAKTPKNRLAGVQLCTLLVRDFGTEHFPVKDVLAAMPPLFNDVNAQVRKEAAALCCECYKYVGAAVQQSLAGLRDVQLQELEQQFAKVQVGQRPPRSIKGLASSHAGGAAAGRGSGVAPPPSAGGLRARPNAAEADDEAFEMFDESPVLSKLPKKFFQTALDKETPWQERCQYVTDNLLPLLSAPRFRAKDDYHELVALIKLYLTDAQAPPMLLGFKMVQECARGLRAAFAPHTKQFVVFLFDKMVDKKVSVLLHVKTTLEALLQYHCVTLDQCQEDMERTSQSKSPNQRLALINFCNNMIDRLDPSQYQRLGRSTAMLKRFVNDEKPENRDAGYAVLAKLVAAFGTDQLHTVLHSMDDKQMAKYESVAATIVSNATANASKTTPKGDGGPGLDETPSRSPQKKVPRTEVVDGKHGVVSKAVSRKLGGSAAAAAASNDATARGAGAAAAGATSSGTSRTGAGGAKEVNIEDPLALESHLPNKYETTNLMLGYLGGDDTVYNLLRSADWAKRLDGLQKLQKATETWTPPQIHQRLDVLCVFLRNNPTFKEPTVQVFNVLLAILSDLATRARQLPPAAAYVIVSGCTPRLTEPKNKSLVLDLFDPILQHLGERFVIKHVSVVATQMRNPRLFQECNEYILDLVDRFKESGNEERELDVKGMVHYIKKPCLEITVPAVRTGCYELLFALRPLNEEVVDAAMAAAGKSISQAYEQECQKRGITPTRTSGGGGGGEKGSRKAHSTTAGARVGQRPPVSSSARANRDSKTSTLNSATASSRFSATAGSAVAAPRSLGGSQVGGVRTGNAAGTPRGSVATNASADVPVSLKPIIREITHGADWRARLEAVRRANEHALARTIPPAAVGPLMQALAGRLTEANKNFVVEVLAVVSNVTAAVSPDEVRMPLKKLLPGALAYLGDQKQALRDESRNVLFLGVETVGLHDLLPVFQKPLKSDSNMCRLNALQAMAHGFETAAPDSPPMPRAGLQLLVPSVCLSLMDRMQEVRAAAEVVVGYMLQHIGDEPFMSHLSTLKPADQHTILPAIERQLLQSPGGTAGSTTTAGAGPRSCTHASSLLPSARNDTDSRLQSPSPPRLDVPQPTTPSPKSHRLPERHQAVMPKTLPSPHENEETEGPPSPRGAAALSAQSVPPPPAPVQDDAGLQDDDEEEVHTLHEIQVGLQSASPHVAYVMCTDFMKILRSGQDCVTPEMIQAITERLSDNVRRLHADLALALVGCLGAVVTDSRAPQRLHSAALFRLLGSLYECLLSDEFATNETVIKALNNLILKILQHAPANHTFSALLSLMAESSSAYLQTGRKKDLKSIQVTVKCLMRVSLPEVTPENVVVCCHEYLLQYPPSAFRNLDDVAIRSIKTILQRATKLHGSPLLSLAESRVGPNNVVVHFIRMCLNVQNEEKQQQQHQPQESADANTATSPTPRGEHQALPPPQVQSGPPSQRDGREENEEVVGNESEREHRASLSPAPRMRSRHESPTRHVDPVNHPAAPAKTLAAVLHTPPRADHPPRRFSTHSASSGSHTAGGGGSVVAPQPPATRAGAPFEDAPTLAAVFSRIRNHETSAEGIEDLYQYLRSHEQSTIEADFNHQFNRCSEPFRMYLKRKLEKRYYEDRTKPEGFQLPQLLIEL